MADRGGIVAIDCIWFERQCHADNVGPGGNAGADQAAKAVATDRRGFERALDCGAHTGRHRVDRAKIGADPA